MSQASPASTAAGSAAAPTTVRMTPPADQRVVGGDGNGPAGGGFVRTARSARRAQWGIVAVLIVALVLSGLTRHWALALQDRAFQSGPYAPAPGSGAAAADASLAASGGPSLGSLDSYFLVLLLGGLRGPLVMFLWASSESQKNERQLEDFDTKVEMIRLLQPEFDSVHLFQAWNKAYNVSVQIPSLPNKYSVILDAVRYLEKVDQSRPNNLNILLALNQIYQHKLGTTAQDSVYYRRQIREDSKWRDDRGGQGVGALQQRLAPILEKDGTVQARLVEPKTPRPTDRNARIVLGVHERDRLRAAADKAGVALPADQLNVPAGVREMAVALPEADARKLDPLLADRVDVRFVYADWNDGSELQYLRPYGPYPYGVSPLALGFNYLKRAQVLMNLTGQRPAQASRAVIDSRTGGELRGWMEDEWERALAAEARLFGLPVAPNRFARLTATAEVPVSAKPGASAADLDEAMHSLKLAHRLARDARAEFTRHLTNPAEGIRRVTDYSSHMDNLAADQLMTAGDLAYLSAIVAADVGRRDALLAEALDLYAHARARYQHLDLQYYTPGEAKVKVLPGVGTDELSDLVRDPQKMNAVHQMVMGAMPQFVGSDQTGNERAENVFLIGRATARINQVLVAQGKAPPATAPAATQPAGGPAAPPPAAPVP